MNEINAEVTTNQVTAETKVNRINVSFVQHVSNGAVTVHGQLSGLDQDDHPQYLNEARHDAINDNPHSVTASQVGLGNVDNTADADKPVSTAQQAALDLKADAADLSTHEADTNNPHSVTKTQIGLSAVPNLDTTDAVTNEHTHSNKALLDTYTQTELNLADAVSKKHEHSNKTQLDLITDGDHDVRTDNPHTVTKTQVGLSNVPNIDTTDAVANEHIHANKVELDLITDGDHDVRIDNPHAVTKSQVGLSNVDNTSDANKPVSTATQTALDLKADDSDLTAHTGNTSNPHSVTKTQVGLGSVTNDAQIPLSQKGANNGVAELDATGKVPSAQLPSYTDDVLEYADFASLPVTGESGKIYVTLDTNITYRWSGSAYVEISASLALGETSTTAYRGDRGKTAYDHSQLSTGNPHSVDKSDVGLSNVPNLDTTSAVANDHTHSNKTILDNIQEALTSALKGNYDAAYTHSQVTTGNPHSVTKVDVGLGSVPNLDTTDAVANEHTHANQTVLDNTTASYTTAEETKLAGIEAGATANDTDANLKNRANHTGTQTAATISDFDTEVSNNASVVANTAKVGVTTELKPTDIDTLAELNAIITDATLIDTGDSRLSDARTPTAHTHTASEVTDFDTEVGNNATVVANTNHKNATGNPHNADLDDLNNVSMDFPSAGHVLLYSGTLWENKTLAAAGIAALAHTHTASEITDFDTEVSNNTAVAANTAKNSYPSADATKLAGIEAGADVTDTANVTAAGALMDSEVDADIKTLSLPANTTISAFGKTLVDDADADTALATLGTAKVTVSSTAPSSPSTNDLWVDIS